MQPILLFNFVSFLACAILCFIIYLKAFKIKENTFGGFIGLISLFYFSSAALNLLWFFNVISWNMLDSIIVGSAFIMPVAAILLVALERITSNKKLWYFLFIFIFVAFGFGLRPIDFFITVILVSFSLIMLLSVEISISKSCLSKMGLFGALYGLLSIILVLAIVKKDAWPLWFIPNIFLFLFYYFFLQNMSKIKDSAPALPKESNLFITTIKYSIFIITILAFLLFSIVAVHEIGHGAAAQALGCESKSVLFESKTITPFTEVLCPVPNLYKIIALAGILLPLLFGVLMMVSGDNFVKNLGLLVMSLSLFITYSDFLQIGISVNYIILFYVFAAVFMAIAVIHLANSYLKNLPEQTAKKTEEKNKKK